MLIIVLSPIITLAVYAMGEWILRPVGWLLAWIGVVRPGHSPPRGGVVGLVFGVFLGSLLAIDVFPLVALDDAWLFVIVFGAGPYLFASVAVPVLSSSRVLHGLLAPLRRWARTEPLPVAAPGRRRPGPARTSWSPRSGR